MKLLKCNHLASGLSLVPKLRKDHVYLTSYSKMKVNLAVQVSQYPSSDQWYYVYIKVLSSSVANALEYCGEDETVETRAFIRLFDCFFDCLNVCCISESVLKRKPDLRPYKDPNDARLVVR